MYILGIGEAFPETRITNDLLVELQPSLRNNSIFQQCGITERRSVLSPKYIQSGDFSPSEAEKHSLESPTDLAYRAAKIAIARAGIEPSQIGLVIGDCSTPVQITPSEGQRLAARFDLKIPAYDISSAQGAFIVHLDTLGSWKEERFPEYILCITTHTPTQCINYKEGIGGVLLGDGAAAYIVSMQVKGKLKYIQSQFSTNTSFTKKAFVDLYDFAYVDGNFINEVVRPGFSQAIESQSQSLKSSGYFIGPQSDIAFVHERATQLGFSAQNIFTPGISYGEILGGSAPSAISLQWGSLKKGEFIYAFQAGMGLSSGSVTLQVEE